MILIDGDILVRPIRSDDAEALYEAARESIPEVSPWLPWLHENYTIEETREFLSSRLNPEKSEEVYSFGVFDLVSGRWLGGIGLNFFNRVHQMANLGYWVRTGATGKGVGSRATRLVAGFGFAELGLQRIEIIAAVSNIASQRVAEKAGAVRECVARDRLLINGKRLDAVVFSLLPKDLSGTDSSL